MVSERRKFQRIHFNLPIKLSNVSFDAVTETKNVSGSGAYCAVSEDIELMTKLGIILLVPVVRGGKKNLKKVNCTGIVVRKEKIKEESKSLFNIGIFFSDLKKTDRKILVTYLDSLHKNAPST
jgi:PilZ domain-containing protein